MTLSAVDPERLQIPVWVWAATIAVMAALLLFDVLVIARRPRVPSTREVGGALVFYVGAAIVFGLGLWWFTRDAHGTRFVTEYYAGWLTEYSLSVDNLFIFLLIMARFGVPEKLQQSALMIGIIIAIVLRGVFIAVGAAAIKPVLLGLLRLRRLPGLHRGQARDRARARRGGPHREATDDLDPATVPRA